MLKHESKYCPRCNTEFECKVGSIHLCQCTTVSLDENERDFMKKKFTDCLCANCMKEVKAEYYYQAFQTNLKKNLGKL